MVVLEVPEAVEAEATVKAVRGGSSERPTLNQATGATMRVLDALAHAAGGRARHGSV